MNDHAQFERTLKQVESIKPGQSSKIPFLVSMLGCENPALRSAAISAIERCFDLNGTHSDLGDTLLKLLDHEEDEDVIRRLITVICDWKRNSADALLAARLHAALCRFASPDKGTTRAFHFGLIKMFFNLGYAEILRLPNHARDKMVSKAASSFTIKGAVL